MLATTQHPATPELFDCKFLDVYAHQTYAQHRQLREADMLTFQDETARVDERNNARMNFRTKPEIKEAIQTAAALSGVDDTTFTMSAAYREAKAVIAAHQQTFLQPVDHAAFFAALDNPPAPTRSLVDAFKRHRRTVVSK